jgi:hypothetical protein
MFGSLSEDAVDRQREAQIKIESLLDQEEIYWVQRGRANWLRHGDKNTSFFHGTATARKKRNFIKKLKNDLGECVEVQG